MQFVHIKYLVNIFLNMFLAHWFPLLFLLFAPLYLTSKTHFKIQGNRTNHGTNTITKGTPSPSQLLNTPPLSHSPSAKCCTMLNLFAAYVHVFAKRFQARQGIGGIGCVAEATKRSAKPIKRFFARRPDRLCLSVCPSMNCKCPAGGQLTIAPAAL